MVNANVQKLKEIIKKANKSNINIQRLPVVEKNAALHMSISKYSLFISIAFGFAAFLCYKMWLSDDKCLISLPDSLSHAFRPPVDCNFCRNVTQIDRISNISPDEFEEYYAYNAKPVVVTDATLNWTALDVFDFWYFKDVYESLQSDGEKMNCQFFPVKDLKIFCSICLKKCLLFFSTRPNSNR